MIWSKEIPENLQHNDLYWINERGSGISIVRVDLMHRMGEVFIWHIGWDIPSKVSRNTLYIYWGPKIEYHKCYNFPE